MTICLRRLSPLALLIALPVGLRGQQDSAPGDSQPPGATLVPLPAIFYQPETGTGFGLVTTYYFRLGRTVGVDAQPSTAQLIAVYTTKKQTVLRLATQIYTDRQRNWITGQVDYSKFPNKYWGIGNDTGDDAEEDYTPRLIQAQAGFQRRVRTPSTSVAGSKSVAAPCWKPNPRACWTAETHRASPTGASSEAASS